MRVVLNVKGMVDHEIKKKGKYGTNYMYVLQFTRTVQSMQHALFEGMRLIEVDSLCCMPLLKQ
jgi:hypothetical protein